MKAPFPWFGSKSKVADVAWRALGDPPNFVEPFAGSCAVLLGRETPPKTETVNDLNVLLVNFWRAMKQAPEEVARHADYPVSEVDLTARHRWLVERVRKGGLLVDCESDPDYCDPRAAAWWAWGLCQWIGPAWCEQAFREKRKPAEGTYYARHRGTKHHHPEMWGKFPEKMPALGSSGMGIHAVGFGNIFEVFDLLSVRLRRVRITCGDWRRVLTPAVTTFHGVTGVFLDPPYEEGGIGYSVESEGIWNEVARWAEENGDNPRLRIVLCGYEGMPAPEGWRKHEWKARGGYGLRAGWSGKGVQNSTRERLWLSKHCQDLGAIGSEQMFLG